jgi:hypothetical protein
MKQISPTEALLALKYGQHVLVRNDGNEYLIRVPFGSTKVEQLELSFSGSVVVREMTGAVILQWVVTGQWFEVDSAVHIDRTVELSAELLEKPLRDIVEIPVPQVPQKVRIRIETVCESTDFFFASK